MKYLSTLLIAVFYSTLISGQDKETIIRQSLESFTNQNDSIFGPFRSAIPRSLAEEYYIDKQGFEQYLEDYIKQNEQKGMVFNRREFFFHDNISDDIEEPNISNKDNRQLQYIKIPLKLKNGINVIVDFGRTNDFASSYNKVIKMLVNSLSDVLNEANINLVKDSVPPITQIYISATTNGKHGKYSNHYRKEAVDISRINGQLIGYHHFSFKTKERLKPYLSNLKYIDYKDEYYVFIENEPYNVDELFLRDRVQKLQEAMLNHRDTRENYGPHISTKYDKITKKLFEKKVAGHQNHIHFSTR